MMPALSHCDRESASESAIVCDERRRAGPVAAAAVAAAVYVRAIRSGFVVVPTMHATRPPSSCPKAIVTAIVIGCVIGCDCGCRDCDCGCGCANRMAIGCAVIALVAAWSCAADWLALLPYCFLHAACP